MSRSYRHSPAGGMCGGSEKDDKVHAHRSWRHCNKIRVRQGKEPVTYKEHTEIWCWMKDGKFWWGNPANRGGRFLTKYRQFMCK